MVPVNFNIVDEYIHQFSAHRNQLQEIRNTISKAAPQAEETISYGIPTFKFKGNLVHFAMAKKHIGFYPGPSAIEAFKDKLTQYVTSKGAIQFPVEQPLPLALIAKIVLFRVSENMSKTKKK